MNILGDFDQKELSSKKASFGVEFIKYTIEIKHNITTQKNKKL